MHSGARDYESVSSRLADSESPINRDFQPFPILAIPVPARKYDQCSHRPRFT